MDSGGAVLAVTETIPSLLFNRKNILYWFLNLVFREDKCLFFLGS